MPCVNPPSPAIPLSVGRDPLALDIRPPAQRQEPGEWLQTFGATGLGTVVISMSVSFPSEPSHGDL